jgi:hypothetical protein
VSDELRGGQAIRPGPVELCAAEGEQTQVRDAADGRRAGKVVEERDLAEVIAWREGADDALPRVHSRLSLEQDVEAIARFSLANDIIAGANRSLAAERRQLRQRAFARGRSAKARPRSS